MTGAVHNRDPLALTAARAAYERDGVAVIRDAFAQSWVESLLPRAQALVNASAQQERLTGERLPLKGLWRDESVFRAYAFESGAADIAAAVAGSQTVCLAIDQIWAKPPRRRHLTRWHFDYLGWPITGFMLPSIWMALTPVRSENSLEFAAGSHLLDRDLTSTEFIDFEALRTDAQTRFLRFALDPGDAVIFHPLTYHWCAGNTDPAWRIALTTRWFGDDIRYDPARIYFDEGLSFDAYEPGKSFKGLDFPNVPVHQSSLSRHK